MNFDSNRPIYIQIYDAICESVISDELHAHDRIASVREYGAEIGVNPNTVMRSYEKLTSDGIIYNRRGIGYFISENAKETALNIQRQEFMDKTLPEIRRRMSLLGIDPKILG